MALSIKDDETDRLARELAEATGESLPCGRMKMVRDVAISDISRVAALSR